MKFYCDITLLPDAEANLGFLWQKVFGQVHLALVANKLPDGNSAVAVSFPAYADKAFPLGNKLRMMAGDEKELQVLNLDKALSRLADYSHMSSIKPVPQSNLHVNFWRVRFDSNIERLARRRAKRKGICFEDALGHYASFDEEQSKLPYIQLQSSSRGERFRLFIEKAELKEAVEGDFNCYGLSKTATIPWF